MKNWLIGAALGLLGGCCHLTGHDYEYDDEPTVEEEPDAGADAGDVE